MKRPSLPQFFEFLFGPWMIIPLAAFVAIPFGGFIYDWPESTMDYEWYIFFQGSIDMGGGCTFAAVILLYIVFGFTASWYLTIKLKQLPPRSYLKTVASALWILKYHCIAFFIGSVGHIPSDARAASNDFRNMFIFAGILYFLSILFICFLHKTNVKYRTKLVLAPALIVLWLIVGSDGNTERAGQFVSSDKEYVYKIRGVRHSIMVSWHKLCDRLLGEVEK